MADSPQVWLDRLYPLLKRRNNETSKLQEYYEGRHAQPFVTSQYRKEFSQMLRAVSDNWMALVVDAAEERLHVDGFRFGDDPKADDGAQTIWQRNQLDADSELAHSAALVASRCAVMVWAGEDEKAEITVEDPCQVYVAYQPGSRRKRAAAIKVWRDDWGKTSYANVYLPDSITKFQASTAQANSVPKWSPYGMVENPLGLVPVVELVNRPRIDGSGRSEMADVLSTQDQIDKLVCDMIVASELAAFKQRWATGIEVPKNPDTGEDMDPFKSAVDRLWHVSDAAAKFGQFEATDLTNYVVAIENRIQSLASRTRTPAHYLLGTKGVFPSGESLKATETGLIAKTRSKMRHFGESWEEVMRLAFLVEGDEAKASEVKAETIWADPESRSEAEHTDALVKKLTLGVPKQQLWEDALYTPQQIARFKTMLMEQALVEALAAPVQSQAAPPPIPAYAGQ